MAKSEKISINAVYQKCQNIDNSLLCIFINDFVKKFRNYNSDEFIIALSGLKSFIPKGDKLFHSLLEALKKYKFTIEFEGNKDSINVIEVTCKNITKNTAYNFKYQIQNLPSLVEISSKTNIALVGIILTKIVAQLIGKSKILYKAIVLDLDDTLWMGTLAEDGIERIIENMISENGTPFIEFMKFVKMLGNELGVFIAICSRNDTKMIESTINKCDDNIFPLKNNIDYIIANNNDKSENIRKIAEQLSILPESIVFIDDNPIVRDEVKNKLPDVFVPEWTNHTDLLTKLIVSCAFERNELSLNSQNRRKQYRIIQAERVQNSLPKLFVKVIEDNSHIESIKLYSKTNQFKFSKIDDNFDDNAKSLYFELFRQNGENLGICSAITYNLLFDTFHIHNWAISCRYFEIGLEEFILIYIQNIANGKKIFIDYQYSEYNQKVRELLAKYPDAFKNNDKNDIIEIVYTKENEVNIKKNTNLSSI